MSFSIGIVGLPNVGKSTLFNALTKLQALAVNYPFATIEPNIGVVPVPDDRLQSLAKLEHSQEIIPTTIEFVDIAGLVKGAHEGAGLGNQFLSHIRKVDAIAQVVRFFEDDNVIHVDGKVDPKRDIETIETELVLADLQMVEKKLENLKSAAKSGQKDDIIRATIAQKYFDAFSKGVTAHTVSLTEDEKKFAHEFPVLTIKPTLFVANIKHNVALAQAGSPNSVSLNLGGEVGDHSPRSQSRAGLDPRLRGDDNLVTLDCQLESEIIQLPEAEREQYLKELGMNESGLDKLIKASYALLDLITFFTAGPKETRAWTIKKGTKAPQAAGVIHTDFEKGFIKAEAINWKILLDTGGWNQSKEKGVMRQEGKEYVMQDGDVVHFRFNV